MFSKKRFQKLSGLLKEDAYHIVKHDELHQVVEKHIAEMLKELQVATEEIEIVYDDLYHMVKDYLSTVVK